MSRTKYPVTQRYIPEEIIPHPHHCKNLKTHNILFTFHNFYIIAIPVISLLPSHHIWVFIKYDERQPDKI
jgi:hypothetical protein